MRPINIEDFEAGIATKYPKAARFEASAEMFVVREPRFRCHDCSVTTLFFSDFVSHKFVVHGKWIV